MSKTDTVLAFLPAKKIARFSIENGVPWVGRGIYLTKPKCPDCKLTFYAIKIPLGCFSLTHAVPSNLM